MDSYQALIEHAQDLITAARAQREDLTVTVDSQAEATVLRALVVGEGGGGGSWSDLEAEGDGWGIRFVVGPFGPTVDPRTGPKHESRL